MPTKTIKPFRPFFFLREKRNKKTCPLPPQQRGVLLSCSFKNSQGKGIIFGEDTPKNFNLKTLATFILVRLVNFAEARLKQKKNFTCLPVFKGKGKTTQKFKKK